MQYSGTLVEWADPDVLQRVDARGYSVLEAIAAAPLSEERREMLPKGQTHTQPKAFICVDGGIYWLKGKAQQGLVAELIAGRLAASVGAGPGAVVIRCTPESRRAEDDAEHLDGIVVGLKDIDETINARDLAPFLADRQEISLAIEAASVARVRVFQTWLGMSDAQVLVSPTTGKVWSIDHGDGFGRTPLPADAPTVVIVDIHGVGDEVGRGWVDIEPAVERIEKVTDEQLLAAVAQVPHGEAWRSPAERRIQIAQWLASRREQLRQVMESWSIK